MSIEGQPLTLALFDDIEERMHVLRNAYGEQTPSEYAFSNLYFFRQAHNYRYVSGTLPYISGLTYDGVRHILPLFDPRLVSKDELSRVLDGHACLYPIPATVLEQVGTMDWCRSDAVDDADYIYPAGNFRHYRGKLLRKKHNLMQQLLLAHQIVSEPLSDMTREDAKSILSAWMKAKGKEPGGADERACMEALQLHQHFGMDGIVYYVEGLPVGFVIAQQFTPSLAVMRFAKGIDSHKGIYQYMFHHYCMSREHLEWINFEQDLGLANFRQTKRSYQPSSMLRKFRVSLPLSL